ncbi:MAG: hypothetical protein K2J82_08700 [Muribaculaceae bacterium]|nr:hypothetical protein [Muribaculaceae bacterium]MDE6754675.1 hypothetical protein [Muribaculaceae bacterium]
MIRKRGIGRTGLLLAVLAMAVCSVCSFILKPERPLTGNLGVCLPSPNLWAIDPLYSWILNTILLGGIAVGGFFLNRAFNFIRSTEPVLPTMFLVFVGACPWITYNLSSSTIICVVNILSLSVLFTTYKSTNATQEMFTIATLLSVGSMFQYAFIPLAVAYIVGAIAMKAFRIKECLAMIMGFIAPYWVGLGLGLISPDWFKLPEFTNLFSDFTQTSERFVLMVEVGLAIFIGCLLGLNNGIKLYAGNSQVNAMNTCITLLGAVCIICIVADFSNMMAYLATFFFTVAVQVANLCALWNIRREWLVVFIPSLIYILLFVIAILT